MRGRIWPAAWILVVACFALLVAYYGASIAVHLHRQDLALVGATSEQASLVMRLGQYKPLLLKPPFNAVVLLGFPLATLVGVGMLVRWGIRRPRGDV